MKNIIFGFGVLFMAGVILTLELLSYSYEVMVLKIGHHNKDILYGTNGSSTTQSTILQINFMGVYLRGKHRMRCQVVKCQWFMALRSKIFSS